jgi:hypothetical protein
MEHADTLRRAQEFYDKHFPLNTGWTQENKTDGVTIYTKSWSSSGLPFVRGIKRISGFNAYDWIAVINTPASRRVWDKYFIDKKYHATLSHDLMLVQTIGRGVFPVASRDFLCIETVQADEETGVVRAFATMVKDARCPPHPSGTPVRAEIQLSSWTFTPVNRNKQEVEVDFMIAMDLNGYIPTFIARMASKDTPMYIKTITEYLNKNGVVPSYWPVKGEDKELLEHVGAPEYDVKKRTLDITLRGSGKGRFHVTGGEQAGWSLTCASPTLEITPCDDGWTVYAPVPATVRIRCAKK